MSIKFSIEDAVNQTLEHKDEFNTWEDVIRITHTLAVEHNWKRKGIKRIQVYFKVCNLLNIEY